MGRTPMPELVPLPGSDRTQLSDAQPAGQIDDNETITVTLMLRRRAEVPDALISGPETVTHEELDARYGAESDDIATVTSALTDLGLTLTETHQGSRRMKVSGTVGAMSTAFGTTLTLVTSPRPDGTGEVTHRYRSGGLSVPAGLAGIVTAVLGLDDRPQARPQFRRLTAAAASRTVAPETVTPETVTPEAGPAAVTAAPLTAPQVASFYKFPAGTDGTGQTIAIIELGGGYTENDLNTYFSGLGLTTPSVTAVGVDGGSNSPGQAADGEVELDIEVAGAVAPKAAQVVYFAAN